MSTSPHGHATKLSSLRLMALPRRQDKRTHNRRSPTEQGPTHIPSIGSRRTQRSSATSALRQAAPMASAGWIGQSSWIGSIGPIRPIREPSRSFFKRAELQFSWADPVGLAVSFWTVDRSSGRLQVPPRSASNSVQDHKATSRRNSRPSPLTDSRPINLLLAQSTAIQTFWSGESRTSSRDRLSNYAGLPACSPLNGGTCASISQ